MNEATDTTESPLSGNTKAKADELHSIALTLMDLRIRLSKAREGWTHPELVEGFARADGHLSDADAHIRTMRVGLL